MSGAPDWRAVPYAELDATTDKDLMFFGDPREDPEGYAAYRDRVRKLVDARLKNDQDQGEFDLR